MGGEVTYLHFAAYVGDVNATKMLNEDNSDVNAVDKYKESALHYAAKLGHVGVAKVLLQNRVDVNAVNHNDETALHLAAYSGYHDVAKVLIQNGADVNAVDYTKSTALHNAALRKHIRCKLLLLCFGAQIDEKAIKLDKPELLRPIENRLKLLRDGNRMKTSLMSEEERRFMWNLACVLAIKHPAIALGTYRRIHAFVTFHGIFMGPGYGLGEESIWRK